MSLSPAPSSVSSDELSSRRRKHPRHVFVAWFASHPARDVACPDLEFIAEMLAHPLYCRASRSSVQRWEVMFFCRTPSRAHLQQWYVYGIDIGLKQRSTLLARAALCELLVLRLMRSRGACGVRYPLHHATCVVSRRHFLVSKNLAEALFQEGHRLFQQQRFSDAAKSWGQAALLQHAASHAFLSSMLMEGRLHLPKDTKRAMDLARAGAAMGCPHSKGVLGLCCVISRESRKGLALGRESADSGSCFGQYVVGKFYFDGKGVAQNYAEAVRLFRLAAGQGHAKAQAELAYMLHRGLGIAQDCSEAARLFGLAAAQGYAQAQNNFGIMFDNGQGVAQDYAEAIRWYRLAAAQGNASAQNSLGRMYQFGRGVAQARTEAISWYRLAAAQGHAKAAAALKSMGA